MKSKGYLGYRNCADVLLLLWIENILTNSEYDRIIGKLNMFFLKNKED